MKKNNKGFFLAEAIIIIALVTTVMAFVYPNVSKLYENYKNSVDYYDQPEDLYTLKAVYDYMEKRNFIKDMTEEGCKIYNNNYDILSSDDDKDKNNDYNNNFYYINTDYLQFDELKKLYITGYMTDVSNDDPDFNKYLKRLKKTTYDKSSYRLIGVFKNDNIQRYASIKIDNPNPNRNCNLGG